MHASTADSVRRHARFTVHKKTHPGANATFAGGAYRCVRYRELSYIKNHESKKLKDDPAIMPDNSPYCRAYRIHAAFKKLPCV